MAEEDKVFDFKSHEQASITAYPQRHAFYAELATVTLQPTREIAHETERADKLL